MDKKDLRIVFFGTPEFAVESLKALVLGGYNVVAVVTMPDKEAGRGQHVRFSDVKKYALDKNLPLLQPVRLKDEQFIEELRNLKADLFIVIAFRMLPEVVWSMPPMGTFNLHGSLLPRYRGAAPLNRAVMNGDTETGVTTFLLKKEIDTGDILAQEKINIGPDENVGSVHDRLMKIGARLTVDTVEKLMDGSINPIPQDNLISEIEPTPAPKIFKEDCKINWTDSAVSIHNQVRGLSPYPSAFTMFEIQPNQMINVKILESRLESSKIRLNPGELALESKRAFIGCGNNSSLELITVQPAGKRPMSAADFLRGIRTIPDGKKLRFM